MRIDLYDVSMCLYVGGWGGVDARVGDSMSYISFESFVDHYHRFAAYSLILS